MSRLAIVFILFLSSVNVSCAGIFGPKDYDECILESMKGVTSDVAAKLIRKSCREKFPLKKSIKFSEDLKSKIIVKADFLDFVTFGGTIYNNTKEYTITEVCISINRDKRGENDKVDFSIFSCHPVYLKLPPRSNVDFNLEINNEWPDNYKWKVNRVKGYRK